MQYYSYKSKSSPSEESFYYAHIFYIGQNCYILYFCPLIFIILLCYYSLAGLLSETFSEKDFQLAYKYRRLFYLPFQQPSAYGAYIEVTYGAYIDLICIAL